MNLAEAIIPNNVAKNPMKSAIGFKKGEEWKEINWKSFQQLIYQTAHALAETGITTGDRVAIYSDNSAEWMTFDLAIMALGGVSVPIYSTNTADQAEFVIKDSGAKAILVGDQAQHDAAVSILKKQSTDLKTIVVSKKKVWISKEDAVFLEDFIASKPTTLDIVERSYDDLATIIYTSGTTGVPKGVMLTHGNFIHAFDAHFDFFNFKNFQNEVSLAFLPLSHVFERSWSLLCLYGGARVYFNEDPKSITSTLVEVKPTMMCAVPRLFQKVYSGVNDIVEKGSDGKKKIFANALEVGKKVGALKREGSKIPFGLMLKHSLYDALVFKKIKNKMGGKLWFLPCGGASISPEVTEFFEAIGIPLRVGYGLSETTATLTAFAFTHYKHGSCGTPLPGVEIKIGAENEILAKGSGIMKGYYNRPEETAAVFTEDGYFRTGDAGYLDEEGNLFLTERLKDLMKTSNGKYIAPQQIENIMSNNSWIQQIMLVAEGRQYVSALIVPNFEVMEPLLKEKGISFSNWEEAVKDERVIDLYKNKLKELQTSLPAHEQIKRFTLMPKEFEIATGELTPSLKIKRNVVLKNYADLIEKMY